MKGNNMSIDRITNMNNDLDEIVNKMQLSSETISESFKIILNNVENQEIHNALEEYLNCLSDTISNTINSINAIKNLLVQRDFSYDKQSDIDYSQAKLSR